MMSEAFTTDWRKMVANQDCTIQEIYISQSTLQLIVERWDAKTIALIFSDYYGMCDKCSIPAEIGDINIQDDTPFLSSLMQNGFTQEELLDLKSFSFCDPWDGHVILEILAKSVKVE